MKNAISLEFICIILVPANFDRDLAYVVKCSYADHFLTSSRNYDGTIRLFDLIPEKIISIQQSYTVSTFFPLLKEFERHVVSLKESGIRDFWKSKLVDDNTKDMKSKLDDEQKKMFIDFKSMIIPFGVLALGSVLGLFTFTFEHLIHQTSAWNKKKVKILRKTKKGRWSLKTEVKKK